ncbi:hypothetical protein K443DRAFT_633509, partial [Laccaria amethystina LaAM-08-1]
LRNAFIRTGKKWFESTLRASAIYFLHTCNHSYVHFIGPACPAGLEDQQSISHQKPTSELQFEPRGPGMSALPLSQIGRSAADGTLEIRMSSSGASGLRIPSPHAHRLRPLRIRSRREPSHWKSRRWRKRA